MGELQTDLNEREQRIRELEGALQFCVDLSEEELAYAKVGTGAEIALRHISRRARTALEAAAAKESREVREKVYLGDSVYARFDCYVAGDVMLTTENGKPDDPSNIIYLEPEVLDALEKLRARTKGESNVK